MDYPLTLYTVQFRTVWSRLVLLSIINRIVTGSIPAVDSVLYNSEKVKRKFSDKGEMGWSE